MNLGFSLYFGSGLPFNLQLISRMANAGLKLAFTSLHIPEETNADYVSDIKAIFETCQNHGVELMVDIGPRTIEKLGYTSIGQLVETPIRHIRLDYGFSPEEMIDLSKTFHIVLNASTLSGSELRKLTGSQADLNRFSACHNFYPKPHTAISVEDARRINDKLDLLGIAPMMFIAGDKMLRGPLFEGLPTIEAYRHMDPLLAALKLKTETHCDTILIGDVDVSDQSLQALSDLANGFVTLNVSIEAQYQNFLNTVHHDRPDSSPEVIRSQESRQYATPGVSVAPTHSRPIKKGDILLSNEKYLRYSGELEIARTDLPDDQRYNVIGRVCDDSVPLLDHITSGFGFLMKEKKHD